MRCVLTRLGSVHRNLRTDEVDGGCERKPTIGQPFRMIAPPLDPRAHIRLVETTPIVELEEQPDGSIEFRTANSRYRWREHAGS